MVYTFSVLRHTLIHDIYDSIEEKCHKKYHAATISYSKDTQQRDIYDIFGRKKNIISIPSLLPEASDTGGRL